MKIAILMISLVSQFALGSCANAHESQAKAKVEYQRGLEEQNFADMQLDQFAPTAWRAALLTDPNSGANAAMWRLAPGFDSGTHRHSGGYHAVVIDGVMENSYPGQTAPVRLEKGGYFTVVGGSAHITKCVSATPCVFFGVLDKDFDFLAEQAK